ncbi:MAG TPA: XRE family transcriptional regulator [Candidatus Omnitrophota bacterium]|nr:XRE family transcriptional regulator [Candidatus Omnitrophota bacterium]
MMIILQIFLDKFVICAIFLVYPNIGDTMDIGAKLKMLRGNMTLTELAKRADVDKAIVSKIETGKMTGTVECHRRLAEVFGLKLSEFYAFMEDEKPEPAELHPGNAKTDVYLEFLEILTTIPLAKKMLPTFVTLKPCEEQYLEETIKKVERFIYVLEGEIDITVESKTYHLKGPNGSEKGDSIYSSSQLRHTLKNSGSRVARALCVSSPPVL